MVLNAKDVSSKWSFHWLVGIFEFGHWLSSVITDCPSWRSWLNKSHKHVLNVKSMSNICFSALPDQHQSAYVVYWAIKILQPQPLKSSHSLNVFSLSMPDLNTILGCKQLHIQKQSSCGFSPSSPTPWGMLVLATADREVDFWSHPGSCTLFWQNIGANMSHKG